MRSSKLLDLALKSDDERGLRWRYVCQPEPHHHVVQERTTSCRNISKALLVPAVRRELMRKGCSLVLLLPAWPLNSECAIGVVKRCVTRTSYSPLRIPFACICADVGLCGSNPVRKVSLAQIADTEAW